MALMSSVVEQSILKALESPTTCTNDILLSVRSVFHPTSSIAEDGKSEKENVRGGAGHARAKSLVSTAKVTKATARTKGHTRQLTVVEVKADLALNAQEKVNFAFQVVNGCIKVLSQLAKEHVVTKRGVAAAGDVGEKKSSTRTTPQDTALRPKSPNARRIKTIGEVCKPIAKASTPAATVATCAFAAICHLQAHYVVKDGKDTTFQVENGTLAVIAKCIDLELADLALEQLQVLKRRVVSHVGAKSMKKASTDVIEHLMDFPVEVEASPILQFAVKIQQHAWQLILFQSNVAAAEKLSTTEMALLKAYVAGMTDRSKASKQMTSMSRLLLQVSAIQGLSIDALFRLRCSAFKLQIEAAQKGSGLSETEAKGVSNKLSRCMEAFCRGSKLARDARRAVAEAAVSPLLHFLERCPACSEDVVHIRSILQRLAGQIMDDGPAVGQAHTPIPGSVTPAESIRLASDGLTADNGGKLLQQALEALTQPLPEEKSTADRLLVEVVGLRRALHKAVSERKISGLKGFAAAAGCMNYLHQYLNCSSARRKGAQSTIEERLRIGKKFVKPFISTLIVCCLHHEQPSIDVFSALEAASSLFHEVIKHDPSFAEERFNESKDPSSSIFITISKLCHKLWNARVNERDITDELAIAALRTGINNMKPWSAAEKEATTTLLKMRYLMDAYVARQDWQSASSVFEELLGECKTSGYFAQLEEQTATSPPNALREAGSTGAILFRCIQPWITIARKARLDESRLVFSSLDVHSTIQGLLLEWQLEQLTGYVSQDRATDTSCIRLIKSTQDQLFRLYDKKTFPVRRLRVGVAVARLLSSIAQLCNPKELLSEVSVLPRAKSFGVDAGLKSQVPHLQAVLEASLALLDPHGDNTLALLDSSLDNYSLLESADGSIEQIGNLEAWFDHVEDIADLYALRRDAGREAKALEIMLQIMFKGSKAIDRQVQTICRLSGAYLLMGQTGKAQSILDAAEVKVKGAKCSHAAHISILLARAEIFLATSEHDRCRDLLQQVARIASDGGDESFVHKTFSASSTTLNVDDRRLIARAVYLNASFSFREGQLAMALRYCTIAKCMLFKIWSSLEQLMPREMPSETSKSPDACPSSDDQSAMEDVQPVTMTRSYSHLSSPQLRMLVPDLVQVAMLEVQIHDFRGAYHDAFSALKHANKIANHVGAGAACLSDMVAADLYVRSLPLNSMSVREEKVQSARARIDMVDEAFLESTSTMDLLEFGRIKATVMAAEEEPEEQLEVLESTMKALQSLLKAGKSSKGPSFTKDSTESLDAVAEKMASMSLDQQRKPSKTAKTKATATRTTKKAVASKSCKTDARTVQQEASCTSLELWHGRLLRETSTAVLRYQTEPDMDKLAGFIERADAMTHGQLSRTEQSIARARLLIHQATEQMSGDIAFNALHDCILAVPPPQQHGRISEEPAASSAKTPRKGKTAKCAPKAMPATEPSFLPLLRNAFDALRQNWPSACLTSSVTNLRVQGYIMSNLSATASACSSGSALEISHPLVLAYHNDVPFIRSSLLNRSIEHPAVEKIGKDDLRSWPSLDSTQYVAADPSHFERSQFQETFIDIIPKAWNVVSLSLANDKTSMKLIRYRSGQSPFCLRIPFAHRESDDPDEEVLDMSLAYERLRSIIKQHEFTPVEAGVTDQADFKKKWWQKKHELDLELRVLLSDVEEQWFSAVKGVFSARQRDRQALSNLQAQLQSILAQHCPAKKSKEKGKSVIQAIKLEPRILELFVGLGDPDSEVEVETEEGFVAQPLAETAMMADGIHDLVRIVLEGLQFAGESIAIDEVDMDNVIIKIIDALRDYYGTADEVDGLVKHTVLILDNQLHGFPWESLPCLRDQSVSRLPSLADLRDRIITARANVDGDGFCGKIISRASGTSLLNPSGDLKKTAQRFQPWLPKLPPNWAHLRKAPDDEGWRDLLSENELFLYVGHGSTSQYVRPGVVKRLGCGSLNEHSGSTCAVSWLIGCGSVAVEDLGEFEPSGMVLSYLAAGSPAVLGALWDVGDIDADHFSITAGDYWGMWDESNKGLDPKLFPVRKKISEEKKALGRGMSMCEAVAMSRGGCKLPYLNGAAFVVYGIPVFLD